MAWLDRVPNAEREPAREVMMMRQGNPILLFMFVVATAGGSSVVVAEVRLPAVMGDNMVLQRGQPLPIWGWADPQETVTVTIADQSATATAGKNGRWQVTLPELEASNDPLTMYVKGSSGSQITVSGVLVGEVWFCTGPSNIFWPVSRCDNARQEIATANYPEIRFFTVQRKAADEPQEDCVGHWVPCSPSTVGGVSGIGYFFARRLHKELDVPIGVLQNFWGGSRIESWTSIEEVEAEPKLKPLRVWWAASFAWFDSGEAKAEYDRQLKTWQAMAATAKAEGNRPPGKPDPPDNPHLSRHRPACLYNGMVAPLIPYGIRGVISYQGLGNLVWAPYARVLLATMIRDWRSRWDQGPFPFGMVQPAPYPCDRWEKSGPDAYALLREAQLLVLDAVPNTGVAPTMDTGDLDELHFTNKQAVGRRMVLWALATVYGHDIPFSGPIYKSMTIEGNRIRVHFKNAGGGLTTSDGQPPSHFTIAGPDKVFHPAVAQIDGDTVLVQSNRVPNPKAVRFAFSDTAIPNLMNKEDFPASLFRTDLPHVSGKSKR